MTDGGAPDKTATFYAATAPENVTAAYPRPRGPVESARAESEKTPLSQREPLFVNRAERI